MVLHLLDLQTLNVHTSNDVGEQSDHVVVAHRHVGDDFLERNLLRRIAFVLLASAIQLEAKLRHFALWIT